MDRSVGLRATGHIGQVTDAVRNAPDELPVAESPRLGAAPRLSIWNTYDEAFYGKPPIDWNGP